MKTEILNHLNIDLYNITHVDKAKLIDFIEGLDKTPAVSNDFIENLGKALDDIFDGVSDIDESDTQVRYLILASKIAGHSKVIEQSLRMSKAIATDPSVKLVRVGEVTSEMIKAPQCDWSFESVYCSMQEKAPDVLDDLIGGK